jgi:hypothetical protein
MKTVTVVYLSKIDQIAIVDSTNYDNIELYTSLDWELFFKVYKSYNEVVEDAKKHVLGEL